MKINIPTTTTKKKPLLIVDKFDKGTVTLLDDSRIGPNMASETLNMIQTQDGLWTNRWGREYYGLEISGESVIDGAAEYVVSDTEREMIAVGGTTGTVYRSQDDCQTWEELTGSTLTPGLTPHFMQINSIMFISNGTDNLVQYNGTTTLSTYSELAAPANVQLSRNVLTTGSYTMYYQITALNAVGESVASTEASIAVNKIRDTWNGTTESIGITWNVVNGASRYQIYWSDESGQEAYIDSVTTNAYTDNATMQQNPYVVVPNDNTTTAPKFKQMELSGNRIWGTNDSQNFWRVHYSGVGQYIAYFSEWYGGGWVDLDKGGREIPLAIKHYKTGKGDSAATVLCNNPEGEGTIWQITLESVTVGETSFTVPIPVKVVGSTGTCSPYGVVKVGNDLIFPNKQGVYTLSNAPQLLNVLATAEKSQLIRPSYRGINQGLVENICGIFHDAKVFFSCAVGDENDTTFIFDYERRNWNWAWNFGAKQWLKATDSNGKTHLLYIPVTGGQLVEVSEDFNLDFGGMVRTSYTSGLLPFSKDDNTFAKVKDVVLTLGRFRGVLDVEILGIDGKKGFISLATRRIEDNSSYSAIDFANALWGNYEFSDDIDVPTLFIQSMAKKIIKVGKKLNKIQVHIYSVTAGVRYSILNFQVRGSIMRTSLPSNWK